MSDEYVVRLRPSPRNAPHDNFTIGDEGHLPRSPKRRRWRRRFIALGVLVALVGMFPGTASDLVNRVFDTAKEPVEALEGDAQIRKAAEALSDHWGEFGDYDVTVESLKAFAPEVHWGDQVEYRSCLDGDAAIVTVVSLRGTLSRLMVKGVEHGDVSGRPDCPTSSRDYSPWRRQ